MAGYIMKPMVSKPTGAYMLTARYVAHELMNTYMHAIATPDLMDGNVTFINVDNLPTPNVAAWSSIPRS